MGGVQRLDDRLAAVAWGDHLEANFGLAAAASGLPRDRMCARAGDEMSDSVDRERASLIIADAAGARVGQGLDDGRYGSRRGERDDLQLFGCGDRGEPADVRQVER